MIVLAQTQGKGYFSDERYSIEKVCDNSPFAHTFIVHRVYNHRYRFQVLHIFTREYHTASIIFYYRFVRNYYVRLVLTFRSLHCKDILYLRRVVSRPSEGVFFRVGLTQERSKRLLGKQYMWLLFLIVIFGTRTTPITRITL